MRFHTDQESDMASSSMDGRIAGCCCCCCSIAHFEQFARAALSGLGTAVASSLGFQRS